MKRSGERVVGSSHQFPQEDESIHNDRMHQDISRITLPSATHFPAISYQRGRPAQRAEPTPWHVPE
jgi:hypothetical protein